MKGWFGLATIAIVAASMALFFVLSCVGANSSRSSGNSAVDDDVSPADDDANGLTRRPAYDFVHN